MLRSVPTTADTDTAAVLRLADLDDAERRALAARGVRFRFTADGRVRHVGELYPVHAPRSLLADLARGGTSVRVSRHIALEPTAFETAIETQAIDLWGYGPTPSLGALGQRVMLGTVEPGLNIFHPHFFRADGGAWPWVDVDDDGAFTPGVDAVDANLDGEIADNERLELLDYGFNVGTDVEGYGNTFQATWDYLYLDSNLSGVREFGVPDGFTEASPGYGEAMFLPDDANGDGELSTDERIYLLGTSQVAAMWSTTGQWVRGEDLIEAPPWHTFALEASHGSSTMGIMTGGQAHPFRGNRGHVPDADIAVVAHDTGVSEDMFVEGMAWVTQEMGAVVVNHSWGARGDRVHLDGSNVIDAAIDAATAEDSVQVCSAGNRYNLEKHRAVTTVDGMASFTASVPSSIFQTSVSELTLDLHWPADEGSFACTVERPDGAVHEVQEVSDGVFENLNVDAFRSDSERGWALLSIEISNPGNGSVGAGTWRFDCTHEGASEVLVHAVVSDGITYAQEGASLADATATGTMVSPGIADTCIAAAGYPIQYSQYGAAIGELEPYSSAGPRFDGAMAVDIAAPVDAVAPTNDPAHPNAYTAFSGTSGSAPQVSAIVGLMRALDPQLGPEEVAQRIRDAGEVDAQIGSIEIPDAAWGYGRLRGYAAFAGENPPPRPRFANIDLDVEYAYDDGRCAATVSVGGVDWDDASFRWDLEYDGTWDTEFEAEDARTLVFDDEAEFQVRLDAAERGFIVAGAVLTDIVPAECFEPPPDPGTGSSSETGDTSGEPATTTDDGEDQTDTDEPAAAGGNDGCGCRSTDAPPPFALALGVLAFVVRRRRFR